MEGADGKPDVLAEQSREMTARDTEAVGHCVERDVVLQAFRDKGLDFVY